MSVPAPHFLLFSESNRARRAGDWRFVLQSADGQRRLEADDDDPEARGERLELLAVVRGLEALDQPSQVTLITPSRYVRRGLDYGLEEWRNNGWHWERHGQWVPVKNADLWRRLDRALRYHQVDIRCWRFDPADAVFQQQARSDLSCEALVVRHGQPGNAEQERFGSGAVWVAAPIKRRAAPCTMLATLLGGVAWALLKGVAAYTRRAARLLQPIAWPSRA